MKTTKEGRADLHQVSLACKMGCLLKTRSLEAYAEFVSYGDCNKSPSGMHVYDSSEERPNRYVCTFCDEPDPEFWKLFEDVPVEPMETEGEGVCSAEALYGLYL